MKLKIKDPFLKKFEDRCEKIGEGGIFNVPLKHSIISLDNKKVIQENLIDVNKKQKSIISRMRNQYNILTSEDYNKIPIFNEKNKENENGTMNNNIKENNFLKKIKLTSNNINNNNNNLNSKSFNIMNKSEIENKLEKIILRKSNNTINKNIQKSKRYNSMFDSNNNKEKEEINKNMPLNERFYKPYSLKDYKNMMNNYQKERFGGLGINMNKDWIKRQKMYNKVKSFENNVFQNFNKKLSEFNIRRIENPQMVELKRIKQQILNSKRFMAQKYGKGVMLNKIREKKRKEEEEFKYFLKYQNHKNIMNNRRKINIINIYDNVINNKKENYKKKLLELKSSLI